ncbi:MAG TPA: hypothetical protein DEP20_00595 [Fusobacteria bacterium]|nr:hypothetical protein [Fusobacteriota bacterium]|tara:strand:+ start:6371 stop:7951 length:1581 start_codon:yes stop_codon:yes gene_type:complete
MLAIFYLCLLFSCHQNRFKINNKIEVKAVERGLNDPQGRLDLSILGDKSQIEDPNYRSLTMIALDMNNQISISRVTSLKYESDFVKELSLKDKFNSNCFHYAARLNRKIFFDSIIPRDRLSYLENKVDCTDLEKHEESNLKKYFNDVDEVVVKELTAINDEGYSPLSLLIDGGSSFVSQLLSWYPDLGRKRLNIDGDNIMLYVVKRGRRGIFDEIISLFSGVSHFDKLPIDMLNFVNDRGVTPLIQASMDKKEGAHYCEGLLTKGAEVDYKDNFNAMLVAAFKQNKEVVEVFLFLGNGLEREKKILSLLKKIGVTSLFIFVKALGLSGDLVALSTIGVKPGFTQLGSSFANNILRSLKAGEEEEKMITTSLRYITEVEMKCHWLDRVDFPKMKDQFYSDIITALQKRESLLRKRIEKFESGIKKTDKLSDTKNIVGSLNDAADIVQRQLASEMRSLNKNLEIKNSKEVIGKRFINFAKKMELIESSLDKLRHQLNILDEKLDLNSRMNGIIGEMNKVLEPLLSTRE